MSIRAPILGLTLLLATTVLVSPSGSVASSASSPSSCVGLDPPSDGQLAARFDPGPGYSGHWGIDYVNDSDGYFAAAAGGRVSFAGEVNGNVSVTLDHGGGLKTSYSYLDKIMVAVGTRVSRGGLVGRIGREGIHDGGHFSVRVEGVYIDPERVIGCIPRSPAKGLRLVLVDRPGR